MFPFLIKLWQWVPERMPFPWQQICTALANEATTVSFLSGEMSGNGQVFHSSEAVAQACLLSSPFERFVGQSALPTRPSLLSILKEDHSSGRDLELC